MGSVLGIAYFHLKLRKSFHEPHVPRLAELRIWKCDRGLLGVWLVLRSETKMSFPLTQRLGDRDHEGRFGEGREEGDECVERNVHRQSGQ